MIARPPSRWSWSSHISRASANRRREGSVTLRTIIIDDDPAMRACVRRLLASTSAADVVGEAGDGDEVLPLISRSQPDLILMDVQMRRVGGIAATRAVTAAHPQRP